MVSTQLVKATGYARLVAAIEAVMRQMLVRAAASVNEALVMRNSVVGRYLVEYEQAGAARARYGARLLDRLASDLAARGVRGLDARTLRDCRSLYQLYTHIRDPVDPEFEKAAVRSSFRSPVDPESGSHLPSPLPVAALRQLSCSHLTCTSRSSSRR